MREIIGNTTATPNPRPDWNQTDETKADYIRNKPDLDKKAQTGDEVSDSGIAYMKDVPVGSLNYSKVSKIGGMTRKCTNLIPYPYSMEADDESVEGLDVWSNDDGSITMDGSNDGFLQIDIAIVTLKPGTYHLSGFPQESYDWSYFCIENVNNVRDVYISGQSFTVTSEGEYRIYLEFEGVDMFSNEKFYPMLNEGSVALPYERYFEGLRHAKVTEVENAGANLIQYPYNILKDSDYGEEGTGSIEFTDKGDGGIIVDGTNYDGEEWYTFATVTLPKGKYCYSFCSNHDMPDIFGLYGINGAEPGVDYKILSGGGYSNSPTVFEVFKTTTFSLDMGFWSDEFEPIIVYPMLNKGSTALPYTPYIKHTLPIPEAVQALDGYGQGNPDDATEYNYIDFENQAFVKKGAIVDGVWVRGESVTDISDILTTDNILEVESSGTIALKNEYNYNVPSCITFYKGNNNVVCADTIVGDVIGTAARAIAGADGKKLATQDYVDNKVGELGARITALEDGSGTGTVYFYDSVVNEILDFFGDEGDGATSIEIDGVDTTMDKEFFENRCTHVNFGGTGDESGAYLFFYEKSVKLSFYEAFPVYVNGEDIASAVVGPVFSTYTAPQVLHVTLHD